MKSTVYRWRVSAELKSELEQEARRRKMSMAKILDSAARNFLQKSGTSYADSDAEQKRLHKVVQQYIGVLRGNNPHRSENVSEQVRLRMRQRSCD